MFSLSAITARSLWLYIVTLHCRSLLGGVNKRAYASISYYTLILIVGSENWAISAVTTGQQTYAIKLLFEIYLLVQ